MFLVRFTSGMLAHVNNYLYDVATAADLISGITGVEEDYDKTFAVMSEMQFGDVFETDAYTIECKEKVDEGET